MVGPPGVEPGLPPCEGDVLYRINTDRLWAHGHYLLLDFITITPTTEPKLSMNQSITSASLPGTNI